jgi:hypothetical protein
MDTRVSIKFEDGRLEQTYKFLIEEGVEFPDHLHKIANPAFISEVEHIFQTMRALRHTSLQQFAGGDSGQ